MKLVRVFLFTVALAGLAGSANAAVITWTTTLSGAQEVPPNSSTATGIGTVTFDDVTNILTFGLDWAGLTDVGIQAHIHCCVATAPGNAPIAIDLWLASDPQPATGSFARSFDLDLENPFRAAFVGTYGGTTASALAALQAAFGTTGAAYFNIHTGMYPGGEIRGNIVPAQVPEPGTLLLLTLGVAGVIRQRLRGL